MADLVSSPAAIYETVNRFGRAGHLSGIVTQPTEGPARIPVVLLGAGIIHKVGPSRVAVQLARGLARAGHPVFRFDLSGIGDSGRAPESGLQEAVVADIREAVSLILEQSETWTEACLLGFCSGADNALYVAADDERVSRLILFDPSIPETGGFIRRRRRRRLTDPRSWFNVLSGHSLRVRLRSDVSSPPPAYYGLLTMTPEDRDEAAVKLRCRGVAQLYILSSGIHHYCSSPDQVAESMPRGFDSRVMNVAWRPDFDHILSTPRQRRELVDIVRSWLAGEKVPPPMGGS